MSGAEGIKIDNNMEEKMNNITWKFGSKLEDATPIKALETAIKVSLPVDYVKCVSENNAGYPSLNVFETEQGEKHIFSDLLSLIESDDDNVYEVYKSVSNRLDRQDIVPFAADPFGNFLCFDFSETPTSIVFWNHEVNRLNAVAKSFTNLINMLQGA